MSIPEWGSILPTPTIAYPLGLDGGPIADSIKRQIDNAIAAIPDGDDGAFLALATRGGVKGTVAVRLNDVWTVAAGGWIPMNDVGQAEGFVGLQASWKRKRT